jgi:Holliday junction resolvase RusA-like endonuclease
VTDAVVERLRALLGGAVSGFSEKAAFVMDGDPPSKARPRFGGGRGVYTPAKQRAAEERLGWAFRTHTKEPLSGPVAIAVAFYRASRQRVDVDNMVKHVFDSANTIAFVDDRQVTRLWAESHVDRDAPRTVIVYGSHVDQFGTVDPTVPCEGCGKTFVHRTYPSWSGFGPRRFCSRKCSSRATQRQRGHVKCCRCGTLFQRKQMGQRMCSERCRVEVMVDINKARALPAATCVLCGKTPLANKYATRCRECWRANPNGSILDKTI